jgi:hypothetical protein
MKKTTFLLFTLFAFASSFGQTYSTGVVALNFNYSVKIDVESTLVTLTMVGPSAGYLGVGFGVADMINSGDCVIYAGAAGTGANVLTDRTFNNGVSVPSLDFGASAQNWTVTVNSVNGSVRTLVATRARVSTGDFTFPFNAGALTLAWSFGSSNSLVYHGGNRGSVVANATLGVDQFEISSFVMYPNPAQNFVSIALPNGINDGAVKIYDLLGKVVANQIINTNANSIDISNLASGSYMVVLRTEFGNATKTLLVN